MSNELENILTEGDWVNLRRSDLSSGMYCCVKYISTSQKTNLNFILAAVRT
jgi:hypothetical protein